MIQVNINQRKLSFTKQEQSIAQAAHARNALAPQFTKLLTTKFAAKSSAIININLSVTDHKAISPNKSAIAAIGEGISGLIAQRLYRCRLLARPNHDFPDLVMDATNKTYLFESKATLSEKIHDTLQQETQRFLSYVAACNGLDSRPVVGVLIGTTILSESDYNCDVWELHLCN